MRGLPIAGLLAAAVYLVVLATLRLWSPSDLLIPTVLLGCLWAWMLLGRQQPVRVAAAAWPPIHLLLLATGSLASPFLPLVALWPLFLGIVTTRLAWLGVAGAGVLIPLTQWTQTAEVETTAIPRLMLLLTVGALLPLLFSLLSGIRAAPKRRKVRRVRREEQLTRPATAPEVSRAEREAVIRTLELVRRATESEEAALWLVNGEGTLVRLHGWAGAPEREAPPSPVVLEGHPFSWALVEQAHIHLERGRRELPTAWAAEMLLIPLGNRGVLALAYPTAAPADAEASALLATDHLTGILPPLPASPEAQKNRPFGEQRSGANGNSRTQLPSQEIFEARFAALSSHFLRYGRSFGLLILQVDHLAALGERHGVQSTDSFLRQLANLLQNTLREVDFAAQISQEEFVVLLPETSLHDSICAAERLREFVAARPIRGNATTYYATVSIGVAACPDCCAAPADAVAAATDALRRAQAAGGNRILVAPIRSLADA